jgi:hypothetical protein
MNLSSQGMQFIPQDDDEQSVCIYLKLSDLVSMTVAIGFGKSLKSLLNVRANTRSNGPERICKLANWKTLGRKLGSETRLHE